MYYRYSVFTTYLPFSVMSYMLVMWALGFTFINIVGMRNRGPDPFCDGHQSHASFKATLLFSIIFFFISGLVVLRQRYDLTEYCNKDDDPSKAAEALLREAGNNLHDPLLKVMFSID